MAGALRNISPGQVVTIQTRNGPRCMTKVPNPSGRTRFKGRFVCNSACGLPTKKPSRKCGGGFSGGFTQGMGMMPNYNMGQRRLGGY